MDDLGELTSWRVGYHSDPLGFAPLEGYEYSHRFDDRLRRWRSIYCAMRPETALREVMSDMRQHTAARARFIERYGPEAARELPPESADPPPQALESVAARWKLALEPAQPRERIT